MDPDPDPKHFICITDVPIGDALNRARIAWSAPVRLWVSTCLLI